MKRLLCALFAVAAFGALPSAQPVFTGAEIFPPEEFAARRAQVMEKIGDAVAILQGTTERPGEQPLRQGNQFFYLTGVVEPRAIVTIDGRAKTTTLYLLPRNERREDRMLGPALSPGAQASAATGIDRVLPRDDFAAAVPPSRATSDRSTRRSGPRHWEASLRPGGSGATKADASHGRISRGTVSPEVKG